MIFPLENPSNYEDVSLPVSPCLTNADQDSAEDQSTNYEGKVDVSILSTLIIIFIVDVL